MTSPVRPTRERGNLICLSALGRGIKQDKKPAEAAWFFVYVGARFNQKPNADDSRKLENTTQELIDLANAHHGTFYLPYQLYYSPEQLRAAYPEIDAFRAAKQAADPETVFTNTWFEKYKEISI